MHMLRRVTAFALSALMAFGHPAEVLAASYVFRQPSAAGTYPIPTITNNVVNSSTYYKVDGRMYSISWQGTGGRSPYVIEIVAGTLPPGCSAPVQTGSILTTSCTFTTEGSYSGIIAQLTDANGMVVRDNAPAIVVSAPAPTLGTYNFPFTGYVATPYTGSLKITGGRQNFTVSRATGELPPGLALSQTQDLNTGQWSVVLSGNPTTVGSYTFDILVTDANQKQATSSKINVAVGFGPVSLTLRPSKTAGTFNLVAGQPADGAGVNVVGGTPPISLSLISGTLPPGMNLSQDGLLSGTPTRPGTYSGIQVRAVDSASNQRTATSALITLNVATAMSAIVMGANDVYSRNKPVATISTTATGGTGPYAYALTGTLPPGLSFSRTAGTISGTPTVSGRYDGLAVTVTDANGFTTTTAPFLMAVADPLTVAGTPPKGVAGADYAFGFTAAGGTPPYSFSLAQGDLPFGLDLSEDGKLTGTPFLSGTYPGLVVRVTDADGSIKDTSPFTLFIADQLSVAGTPAASATRGTAYSSSFSAAGGTAPYSFVLASGALPPGLSLATNGTVGGNPTTAGSYGPFTVRVSDAEGNTATGDASIVVSAPLAVSGTAGQGTVGQAYSARFSAAGGSAPYLFDIGSGVLPAGLAIDPQGLVSGTPSTAGTYPNIVVRVTDADGRTAQQTVSIVVAAPLAIAGTPSAAATRGQTYSASFTATGGTTPYSFSLATGTFPAGISLSSTGAVSGSPTAAGTASGLSVKVTDASGRTTVSDPFQIVVRDPLAVAGTPGTSAGQGQPYSAPFTATGGSTPYVWSLASGALPAGISLDASSGLVSGTPTTLGSYPGIQLRATDADGRAALSSIFGISVSSSIAIAGTPAFFGTVGSPYSVQFTSTGGSGARTFLVASGALPSGLGLDAATGLLSGSPTAKGTYGNISIRVRDETGGAATTSVFQIVISDDLSVSGTPNGNASVGSAYTGFATVAGGRAPYVWSLQSGTLPAGLTLNAATGVIGGTPTTAGTSAGLGLQVADADGRKATTDVFSIVVTSSLAVSGGPAPGTVDQAYSAQFTATGGLGPYTYAVVAGPLPGGLSLDASTGLIAGTPTSAATSGQMQIRATDSVGRTAVSAIFAIVVKDPLRLVPTNIGPGTVGTGYSASMTPTGGRAPYTLTVQQGPLPPGLSLVASTGAITGTPGTAGTYADIVIRGVDADGRTALSDPFPIEVAAGVSVAGVPPQPATVGVPYSFAFTVAGGQAPYSWSVGTGSLPAGIAIDPSTGALGGTPTAVVSASSITAVAADRSRRTGSSQPFAIDVRNPVSVSGNPAPVATTGQGYSAPFAVAGGRGPFVFSMIGTLPSGLNLSASTGTVSGTPTTVGDVSGLQVKATDADGRTGVSSAFPISVVATLSLAGTPAPSGDVGKPYAASFTAAGGKAPYVFSLSTGVLPAGLSLDGGTGSISGTPTTAGTSTGLQVRVVDANNASALSQTFAVAIADPLQATAETGPGTVAATYVGRVAATGGRGPFVYALTDGTLPAGLSISATGGQITGTPSAAGTSSGLQVRITDADGRTAKTPAFSIVVDARLAFAGLGTPAQTGTVGVAYDSGVTAAGGRAPYLYALAAGALPGGLALDAATGRITGTPTTAGLASGLAVSATDADGRSAVSSTFQIDVRDPVVVSGAPSTSGTVGVSYPPAVFTAAGGRASYVFAAAGTLPPGLTIGSAGSLSGAPTTAGSYPGIRIRATDADGRTGFSAPFTIDVAQSLAISGAASGVATLGTAYSAGFAASNGRTPYVFSSAGGPLPAGLVLDAATGSIGGTPTATGSFPGIQIRVTDGDGRTAATSSFGIVVSNGMTASAAPGSAIRGKPYSTTVSVSGGRGPYVYGIAAGALPAGLSLGAATGQITGTPTTQQVASGLQVKVVDADGRAATTDPFEISVAANLSLAIASPLVAAVGSAFTAQAAASGGRPDFAYSVASGTLPAGLSLDAATGQITGTPTAASRSTLSLRVVDADGREATASTTISVANPMMLTATSAAPAATVGQAFSMATSVAGGQPSYVYALVSGTLPQGLSLSSTTGAISGTPKTEGVFGNIVIQATDAEGRTALTSPISIDVRSQPAFVGVPSSSAAVGTQYSSSASASGGRLPFVFSIASGILPAGLSLDAATGVISGSPTTAGLYAGLQIGAVDPDGRSALSAPFQIDVRGPLAVAFNPKPAMRGIGYSATVSVAGGRSPYAFALVAGTLPAGLSLSGTTGTVAGTPTTEQVASGLQIRVTDADGRVEATPVFSLTVQSVPAADTTFPTLTQGTTPVTAAYLYDTNLTEQSSLTVTSDSSSWITYTFDQVRQVNGINLYYNGGAGTLTVQYLDGGGVWQTAYSRSIGSGNGNYVFPAQASQTWRVTAAGSFVLASAALSFASVWPKALTLPAGGTTQVFVDDVNVAATPPTASRRNMAASGASTGAVYRLAGAPPGLSIDPSTGLITGPPTSEGAGLKYAATVTVVDQGVEAIPQTLTYFVESKWNPSDFPPTSIKVNGVEVDRSMMMTNHQYAPFTPVSGVHTIEFTYPELVNANAYYAAYTGATGIPYPKVEFMDRATGTWKTLGTIFQNGYFIWPQFDGRPYQQISSDRWRLTSAGSPSTTTDPIMGQVSGIKYANMVSSNRLWLPPTPPQNVSYNWTRNAAATVSFGGGNCIGTGTFSARNVPDWLKINVPAQLCGSNGLWTVSATGAPPAPGTYIFEVMIADSRSIPSYWSPIKVLVK